MTTNMHTQKEEAANNPYLALREAKIARNQKRLQELGLLKPLEPPITTTSPNKGTTQRQKPRPKFLQEPVRRSPRLSQQPGPSNYKETSIPREKQLAVIRKRPRPNNSLTSNAEADPPSSIGNCVRSPEPSPPAINSVRSVNINTKTLVLGQNGENGLLGVLLGQTGKAFVINESFSAAASPEDQYRLVGARLSFNKYCGVQEWKNALFLWVNLGSKDDDVVNEFLDDAQRITWFGGSRMHDESPVIQKLLEFGKGATAYHSNIVLWCRKYKPDLKGFTPYVCLGRLSYHSHVPGSRPLSFVWNLLDYKALRNHSDSIVRDRFSTFTK